MQGRFGGTKGASKGNAKMWILWSKTREIRMSFVWNPSLCKDTSAKCSRYKVFEEWTLLLFAVSWYQQISKMVSSFKNWFIISYLRDEGCDTIFENMLSQFLYFWAKCVLPLKQFLKTCLVNFCIFGLSDVIPFKLCIPMYYIALQ